MGWFCMVLDMGNRSLAFSCKTNRSLSLFVCILVLHLQQGQKFEVFAQVMTMPNVGYQYQK